LIKQFALVPILFAVASMAHASVASMGEMVGDVKIKRR